MLLSKESAEKHFKEPSVPDPIGLDSSTKFSLGKKLIRLLFATLGTENFVYKFAKEREKEEQITWELS